MKPSTPSTPSTTFTSPLTPSPSSTIKKPLCQPATTPFKTAYAPKITLSLPFPLQGRTKQSFKDECDVNMIMARYNKTGILDFATKHEPQYGDCTGIEFEAGMNIVARARSMFEELPAQIRARFENDPRQLLDFVQNEKNREEAIQLGLVRPMKATAIPALAASQHAAGAPGEAPKGPKQGSDGTPTPPKTNSPT